MFKNSLKTGLPFNLDHIADEELTNGDFKRWAAGLPGDWLIDYGGGGGPGIAESVWGIRFSPAAAAASIYQTHGAASTATYLLRIDVVEYTSGPITVTDGLAGATIISITAVGNYQVVAELDNGVIAINGDALKDFVIGNVSLLKLTGLTLSLSDQHVQHDCCQDIFYVDSDQDHGLPFQFRSNNEDKNPGLVLYNEDGTMVDPQPAAVDDTKDLIEVLNESGLDSWDEFTWYVYNGIEELDADLPVGNYYWMYAITDRAGVEVGYSEVFRVCDCIVEGVGDGEELVVNGYFKDWAELANPNNYPSDWTLSNNDANNYVAEDPVGSVNIISNNTAAIQIGQTILTIGSYYVVNLDIIEVASGSISFEGAAGMPTYSTIGHKNFVFYAEFTTFAIKRGGICDVTINNVSVQEFKTFIFCDRMTLEWWRDCDFDDIIYQYGYHNRLYLPEKTILDTPRPEITKNTSERDNIIFPESTSIKKFYQLKILIPEFIYDALIRLPAYDSGHANAHAVITLSDGRYGVMNETNITTEWQDNNCLCHMIIEFIDDEYPVIGGNCCDDYDISVTE